MAKTPPQRRKKQTRETNWVVIGSLIALGVVAFGALLYLALRGSGSQPEAVLALADFCAQNPDNCAATGDENAPVTMVEVSDFGCSHCTNFHNNTAEQLHADFVEPGTMRWVVLPYALNTVTVPAAAAAMCAAEQDEEQYFAFANVLFGIEDTNVRLSPAGYQQAAESIGLDMDAFTGCMDDGRNLSIVNDNREAARDVGVTGTPTFFLNGEELNGAQPLEVFAQTINNLVASE